jgi:Ca2+-binding RTX toxin-like protein
MRRKTNRRRDSVSGLGRSRLAANGSRNATARRRRPPASLACESLEPRRVLAAAASLDAAQSAALLQGIQVFAQQLQAVQESAILGEPTVALGQPLGTLIHVGDEIRAGLADPLAPLLAGPKSAAQIEAAFQTAAAADDAADNAFAISGLTSSLISADGRQMLWFDLDVSVRRPLPDYQLDLGQSPSAISGSESLLDRGLRLGTLEALVTAAVDGSVSFGVDLAATADAGSSIFIKIGALTVSTTASHKASTKTAIEDVEASFGAVRLGPADVDVELDIAADITLAEPTVTLGQFLAQPAGSLVTSQAAVGGGVSVSIPFTLGIGGFDESHTALKLGVTASDLFHTVAELPAFELVSPTLRPTAGGSFDFAQFGDIDTSSLAAYLVELERMVPELVRDFRIPLVDRTVGDVFDLSTQVAAIFETLRGDGGLPRFETVDELIEMLRDALAARPSPPTVSDFGLAWDPVAQGLQFTLPLSLTESESASFDAAAILPAGSPIDITGRGSAKLGLAGTFTITGGVMATTSAALPAGKGSTAYENRLFFQPAAAAEMELTLDVALEAGAALGPLSVQVYDGEAAVTAAVVASLPSAAAGADGLLTIAELRAGGGGADVVEIAVSTPVATGVFQLKPTPATLADAFAIGTFVADPLSTYAADPDAEPGTPASPVTETVPYFFLSPAAAGATTWEFTLEPSVKLQQMIDGLGGLSMADLPDMFELFIDRLEGFDFWNIDIPLAGLSLADIFSFRDIVANFPDFDIAGLLGLPDFGTGDGSTVTWPTLSFGSFGVAWLDAFDIALPLLSLPDVSAQLPDGLHFKLESLSWDFEGLLDEWQGWTLGDLSLDLDFVGRLRSWGLAADLAFGELRDLDLPGMPALSGLPELPDLTAALGDLDLSLDGLTGFLGGLSFEIGGIEIAFGLEGFGDLFEGAFNLAFPETDFPGLDLTVTPVTGGPSGRLLFDFEITVAYDHVLDFETLDIGLDGAPIPLALDGAGGLLLALDGSFATRLGFDLATASPLIDLDETEVSLTAGIESTTPATPGFVIAATIGGLSAISLGGDGAGQERATLTLSDPADADPSDGLDPAVFAYGLNPATGVREAFARAALAAELPIYVVGMEHLGRITLAGTLDTAATPPFDVTAGYDPDTDGAGVPYYDSLADILADAVFNPSVWFDLICDFTTNLTNGVAADYLGKLPFLGEIDFYETASDGTRQPRFTFFKDICTAFDGVDVSSPGQFLATLPGAFAAVFPDPGVSVAPRFVDDTGGTLSGIDDWSDLGPTHAVVVDLVLTKTTTLTIGEGDLDIGLDALGIEARVGAELDLSFSLDLGLGFSTARGLFVETSASPLTEELSFDAALRITDGSSFAIGLGPITFAATDARSEPELTASLPLDFGTATRLYATDLPTLVTDATVLEAAAGVEANLAFDISADVFKEGFGFGATLALGYSRDGVADGGAIPFTSLVSGSGFNTDNLYVSLTDVGIDLGGLLSGPVLSIMEKIEAALEPVKPITDLLRMEVPLISDLSKKAKEGPVTFLDLIGVWDPDLEADAWTFLGAVDAVTSFADTLGSVATTGRVPLGGLVAKADALASLVSGSPATSAAFEKTPTASAATASATAADETLSALESSGVAFPILDGTVEAIFGLLFGRDVDLVTWDVPDLEGVGFGYEQSFPIFPPLYAKVFGEVEFGTNFDVGYDTRGIRQALADDTVRLARVANGFYFRDTVDGTSGTNDRAEVTLSATIGAAAELDVAVASAGVSGALTGTLGANLRDPNGDGKVHFDEFARLATQSLECVFDFEGALDVSLDAYLKLGFDTYFGFVTLFSESLNLLDERLFSWSEISCPPATPELAEVVADIHTIDPSLPSQRALVLNMGPRAGRVMAGIEDGEEEFTIEQAVDEYGAALPGKIIVKAYDFESRPFNTSDFDLIWFNAGEQADVVTFTADITAPVWGSGGDGNDQLTGGNGVNTFFGGAGRDRLVGGVAADRLEGGDDGDLLFGLAGIDDLHGDAGDDQIYGDDDTGIAAGATQDFIYGGSGADTIFAGDGADRIWGGEGDDTIFGGSGDDRIAGDVGNDQIFGNDGDDVIHGDDDGDATTEGGFDVNADKIEGGAGVNAIDGGPGFDRIWANSEEDGAAAPAAAVGTAFSFYVYGGDHSDTIYGTAGRDFIDGGFESDEIYSGDGADYVTGGPGSDLIDSGEGAAEIFGGYGNDVIVGRGGDDWIEGGPGDDEIYAGLGSDTVYGGTTAKGYPLILAEESGPRPVQSAIHGGYATRPQNGTGESPCEPEIFFHPEVYPDAPYEITVTIYEDTNGNGQRDSGEPDAESTSGWTVSLSAPGQPSYRTSAHGGTASVPGEDGLVAGEWTVTIAGDSSGYSGSSLVKLVLLDETHPTGSISLGVWRPATVTGTITDLTGQQPQPAQAVPVFVDVDKSGDWSTGEPVGMTGYDGIYTIAGLRPASDPYRVLPVLPPERGAATPTQHDVVLRSGAVADCDFEIRLANAPVVTSLLVGQAGGQGNGATTWTVVPDGPNTSTPLVPTSGFRRFAFEVGGPVGLGVVEADAVAVVRVAVVAGQIIEQPVALTYLGTPTDPGRVEYEFDDKDSTLGPGTYYAVIDGAKVTGSNGRMLDAEIRAGGRFPSGDGVAGGRLQFPFVVGEQTVVAASLLRTAAFDDGADGDGIAVSTNAGGTIEGTVWQHDTSDANQGRSGFEPLLAGQVVELYRREGTSEVLAGTVVTGADGAFRFTDLSPAKYTVRQRPQAPWVQATGGGVSRPEQLYAASYTAIPNSITSGIKTYLTRVDVDPFDVTVEASTFSFVARDIAMANHDTAYLVGRAMSGGRTPFGHSGLWRYTFSTQTLEDLGPTLDTTVVGLDTVDGSRLLAAAADGSLLAYTPAIGLWEDLGRMQLESGGFVYPVGDVAITSSRTAYVVGVLSDPATVGDNAGSAQQYLFEVSPRIRGANTRAIAPYGVKANPLEKDAEYLVGLELPSAGAVIGLSHRGNVFRGVASLGDLGNPRNFATTFGGLALAPFGVVPDSNRNDFVIGITGEERATVGFGNEPTGRELLDGDDFLDGGCEEMHDKLFGDDGSNLPRGVVSIGGKDELRGRGGDDLLDGGLQGDVIVGGDGDDTIRGGSSGLNRIEGNAGIDTIDGGAATDVAHGNDGQDTIRGFGGNDLLFGGADPDDLDGGDGADLLVPGSGGDTKGDEAAGGAGDDTIVVIDVTQGGEFAVVPTGTAKDLYDGGAGTDTLLLDTDLTNVALNNTTLLAYGLDDAVGFEIAILAGGVSDNVILAGTFSGRTVIRGRGGHDTLVGGTGVDWIDGGEGDDSLTGNAGDDTLLPGTGTNQVVGGADDDTSILAATGTNTIVEAAGGGTDSVDMSAVGTARLFVRIGSAADGTAIATTGSTLAATFANDGIEAVLLGGGDDEIVLRNGTTSVAAIDAAAGTDTLAYTDLRGGWGAWAAGVTVDLGAGTATSLAGVVRVENVIGGSGGDSLSGDDEANRLDGEGGIDTLVGRGGDDDLHGGTDNDILVGNAGRDTLQGGGGTNALTGNEDDDVYRFSEDGHVDTVAELAGQGFDQLLFTTGTRGITFDVGARIVADDGVGRVTVLLAAGIDRVVGTSLTDTFRIADGAIFPGTLVGGGIPGVAFTDLDVLDYSAWTSGVVVDYSGALDATFVGAATGTGGVVNLRHVIGGTRDDRLVAGALPVWFEGGDGGDRLEGSLQDDRLDGGAGADTILGGFGADRLAGGPGLDTLRGGAGDDRYLFADLFGVDTVHESPLDGRDTMDFAAVTVPLVVRLGSVTATTGAGDLAIHAGSAIEEVVGGGAADAFEMTGPAVTFPGTLDGGGGANSLTYLDATAEIIAAVAGGGTPNVEAARNFATIQAVNNDFTPVFGGGFTGVVSENAPLETIVYTATATDADDAPGNVITYSIVGGLGDDADLVTIEPTSGKVRLRAPANFEAKNAYFFRVMAADAGTPVRSATLDARVNVLNVVEPRTPPRIAAPSGFFFTEDTAGLLPFPGTPFSDADSPAATIMTVTLRIADGSILAASGGGVVVGGVGAVRTFTGTLANLNAFFSSDPSRISYAPAANATGPRTLVVTIAEGPVTLRLSSTVNVPVTIAAVNDPPVLRAPLGFVIREDVPGNIGWPAATRVVTDIDSSRVTVRLSVDAGAIVAAPAGGVAVAGTPLSRSFTGTPTAVSAYFSQLGRIRYAPPLNDVAVRSLLVEASDAVATVSVNRAIRVTPVNDAPTLAAVVALTGAVRNTPFEITHDTLSGRSTAADIDSAVISFRVEAIRSGVLQKWDGLRWRGVSTVAGAPAALRLLSPGQKLRWIPPAGAVGVRPAFTVRAWDGAAFSAVTASVSVKIDA